MTPKIVAAAFFLFAAPAAAQTSMSDPAFLQKAIGSIQSQRDSALNGQAIAEARAAMLQEEVAKLQARVKELEPKPEESKKP